MPKTAFPRDAEATKERLLAAAADEFSRHGLAGARIDRIADGARANKRMIYAYFGSKDQLFDAVLERRLTLLGEIPFDAHDLPGFAARVFDALVADPQLLRLTTWRTFEREEATEAELATYGGKVDAIKAAQRSGAVTDAIPAVDLFAALLALVPSWLGAAAALQRLGGADPLAARRLREHRKALVEIVRRMVAPASR